MNCVRCNRAMLVYELDQVEVDHCVSCGGIWLDGGELELLMGSAAEKETWLKSFPLASAGREEKIKCPICSKKMQKVLYGDKIFLDRCPKNDGLWFDQGELEEMLRDAVVIHKGSGTDTVTIGSSVTVHSRHGEETYTIVGSEEASPTEGKISNESPLGKAFLGKHVGDTADIKTPGGTTTYTVKKIS